jgi:hypothetical protein
MTELERIRHSIVQANVVGIASASDWSQSASLMMV